MSMAENHPEARMLMIIRKLALESQNVTEIKELT
jgi:hypothetical protein